VVPEIAEGSLMLASHALALAGIPAGRVMQRLSTVRNERYAILRGFFHGADDHEHESIEQEHLHLRAVGLMADSAAIGRALGEIKLNGALITAVVGARGRLLTPPPELVLEVGDTVVLSGTVDQIGAAEARLLGGG
jgi:CPA2 family monovalent cation:H+ antiporter-2